MKNYNRITFKERIEIEKLLALNNSYSAIAIKLGRHKSSIAREVKNYSKKQYQAYEANLVSYLKSINRKFGKSKILLNPKLQDYIHKKLAMFWSPDQISRADAARACFAALSKPRSALIAAFCSHGPVGCSSVPALF